VVGQESPAHVRGSQSLALHQSRSAAHYELRETHRNSCRGRAPFQRVVSSMAVVASMDERAIFSSTVRIESTFSKMTNLSSIFPTPVIRFCENPPGTGGGGSTWSAGILTTWLAEST